MKYLHSTKEAPYGLFTGPVQRDCTIGASFILCQKTMIANRIKSDLLSSLVLFSCPSRLFLEAPVRPLLLHAIKKGFRYSRKPLILVQPTRFELVAPWFVAKYSIQLSYGCMELIHNTIGSVKNQPLFFIFHIFIDTIVSARPRRLIPMGRFQRTSYARLCCK